MRSPITVLMFIAGLSVVAFCGIGIAGMAGMLSLADSPASPFAAQQNNDLAIPDYSAAIRVVPTRTRQPVMAAGKHIEFRHGRPVAARINTCEACGVIETITRRERRNGSAEAVPDDSTASPLVGVAYATPGTDQFHEKTVSYVITVRMDDGSYRTLRESTKPGLRPGIRVNLANGVMVHVR